MKVQRHFMENDVSAIICYKPLVIKVGSSCKPLLLSIKAPKMKWSRNRKALN